MSIVTAATGGGRQRSPIVNPPSLSSAVIEDDGVTLTLLFSDPVSIGDGGNGGVTLSMSGGAVSATYSGGAGSTTLGYSLDRTIDESETGTASYTQPGDGIEGPIHSDVSSFASVSVTNASSQTTGGSATPPTVSAISIGSGGGFVSVKFSEPVYIGSGGNGGWTIDASGGAATVSYAAGDETDQIDLQISRTIEQGETCTLSYTQPGDGVEDSEGDDLESFADSAITNNSTQTSGGGDTTAPSLSSATIPSGGTTLELAFNETVTTGTGGGNDVALSLSGGSVTATLSSGEGTSTLTYSLDRTVFSTETGTVDYTQPGDGIKDTADNDLVSFSDESVTNNSTQTSGGGGGAEGFTAETNFKVEGTLGDDETITITDESGSNRFGSKPGGEQHLYVADAEYGDTGFNAGLSRGTTLPTFGFNVSGFQTSVKQPNTQGAFQYENDSGGGEGFWKKHDVTEGIGSALSRFQVHMSVRTNYDGNDANASNDIYNLKGIRGYDSSSGMAINPAWGQHDNETGGPRFGYFADGNTYTGAQIFGLQRFKNTWRSFNYWQFIGGASQNILDCDGQRVVINGYTGTQFPTMLVGFQQQHGWLGGTGRLWHGHMIIDQGWCCAIISDQSTWTTNADHGRATCIVTAWSSNQISVRLRKRQFASLSGKYLYVITNDGTVLKIGSFD